MYYKVYAVFSVVVGHKYKYTVDNNVTYFVKFIALTSANLMETAMATALTPHLNGLVFKGALLLFMLLIFCWFQSVPFSHPFFAIRLELLFY